MMQEFLPKRDLPDGWKIVELQEVADFLRGPFGSSVQKSVCVTKSPNTYKLYEQGNVINNDFEKGEYYLTEPKFLELRKFEVKSGDILMTCAGTLGRTAIVPEFFEKGIINSVLMRIRLDNSKIMSRFFLYTFMSPHFQYMILSRSYGAALKNIFATKQLKKFKLVLPPISVQKQSIEKLDRQIAQIEILRKEAEKEKDAIKEMLESYSELVFNKTLIESGKKVKVSEVTKKIGSGSTPKGGYTVYDKQGIPFIRSMNVLMNSFSKKGLAYINKEIDERMKETRVEKNDVLLNITGASIGRVCVVPDEICPANVNQHVSIIRLCEEINPYFFSYYAARRDFQKKIMLIQSGATRQALTKSLIGNLEIPLLDRQQQEIIVNRINAYRKEIADIQASSNQQLQAISQLHSSVLNEEIGKYNFYMRDEDVEKQ